MKTKIQKTGDILGDKTFNLAVRIVHLSKFLKEEKKEYLISNQVFRAGTNPGAMLSEARNAESDKDFIHKLAIGQKETAETLYWLKLLYATKYIDEKMFHSIHTDAEEVMKLLRSAILTKKKNMRKEV